MVEYISGHLLTKYNIEETTVQIVYIFLILLKLNASGEQE